MKRLFIWALCGFFSSSAMAIEPVDGIYQIGSATDWAEFAELVNHDGRQHQFNAVVTQDFTIDDLVMVGAPSNAYSGTFDGQGHTITIHFNQQTSGYDGECGLFRRINTCTIKNLRVEGDITTQGLCAGGIVSGIWQRAVVENCVCAVTINDENGGDGTHGGIVARISDKSDITIRNCAFIGTINAPYRAGSGGIVGWPDNGGSQVKIENCLMAGTLNLATGQDNDVIVRNSATVTNCYFLDQQEMNNQQVATQTNTEQMASGELCYLLNGRQSDTPAWFQTLGTDEMPSPLGEDVVYANGQLNCDGSAKEGSELTYANTNASERDPHQWNEWGFCSFCNEMQEDFLTPDEEGFYPIATKMDYNWFMVNVNNKGNIRSNAKLTADLDLSDYTFIPIGTDGSRYAGTFDGQGYRILNMKLDGTKKEQGFFSVCQGGSVIKNLIIDASCTMEGTGGGNVAALIGCINGDAYGTVVSIQNVGNEMSFTCSTTNNAGFVARDWSGNLNVVIDNSYNTGNIYGGVENGAFTAWTPRVTLNNCWSTGRIEATGGYDGSKSLARGNQPKFNNSYDLNSENTDNAGAPDGYTEEWMTSGQLCYVMNGKQSGTPAWYQLIGTDPQPMPFEKEGAIVYANGNLMCDGITPKEGSELTFSNTEGNTIDEHQFEQGFCTVCQTMQPDYVTPVEGVYEVGIAPELKWVATLVNTTDDNKGINIALTNDIDFSNEQVMIGNGDNDLAFSGTFDGRGHKVTLGYNAEQKNVGLFRYLNKATVKNLITDGTIRNENNSCAGGIFAGSRGATLIENCVSYVTFNRESGGDATAGGIGAYMHDDGTIIDCAFLGTINTPSADGNGGILGYANGGDRVTVSHCLVNADITVSGNTAAFARNLNNFPGCYYVNKGAAFEQATAATEEQLASGELCYLLNDSQSEEPIWYQLIATDPTPLPFYQEGAVVYITGTLACDGTPNDDAGFSNTYTEMTQDDHNFESGLCTRCGAPDSEYLVAEEGVYNLASAHDVVWFAAMISHEDNTLSARLADNIDFTDVEFTGIGTEEKPFAGNFDGQQHIVSNLTIDISEEGNVGFFRTVTAPAAISNFTIDNSCYIVGHHYTAAFVGHTYGNGTVTLERLGNEAEVQTWNQNAAGIVGCNTSGELKLIINNCYNAATITCGNDGGGISGWLGNNAEVTNSYNMGEIYGENCESFARGNDITAVNCFDPVSDWAGQITPSPIEDFTNGIIFALLDEYAPGIWHLSAEENGHPVLYDSGFPVIIPTDINAADAKRDAIPSRHIYDLQGRRVSSQQTGIQIVRQADGTVRKTIRQ